MQRRKPAVQESPCITIAKIHATLLILLACAAPVLAVDWDQLRAQNEPSRPIVIAQGVVTFTEEPIDWRVYEFEADPEAPREAVAGRCRVHLRGRGWFDRRRRQHRS